MPAHHVGELPVIPADVPSSDCGLLASCPLPMSLSHPNPAAAMGKGGSPPTAPSAEMAASFLFAAYSPRHGRMRHVERPRDRPSCLARFQPRSGLDALMGRERVLASKLDALSLSADAPF